MSLFRIDILDATGNQVGIGPLTNVFNVSRTRSLDKIGQIQFSLPATDPATAEVGAGRRYRVYHSDYGLIGTYYHASETTGIDGNTPMLTIKANDELIELARKNVYFRRNYDDVAVNTAVSGLIALVDGWSDGTVETGIGNTTVSYEGETVFEAIDVIRDRWRKHFRLNGVRVLDFGAFGDDSGIRLIRADSVPREMDSNTNIALVTRLSIVQDGEAIINRVIPIGAGVGQTQLTLEYVTTEDASYPVETGTNADSSSFYYIEDSTSQASYGTIEYVFERNDIRQLTNSETNLENAADALYQAALAFLLKYKDERTQYEVRVTNLDPASVLPGDTVNLFYRGIVERDGAPFKWVDIDQDLYILDVRESWGADTSQAVSLTVGTSADRQTRDADILSGLVRDAKVFKTHVQPSITKDRVGPYTIGMDSTHNAQFRFEIGDETQALNYALLRFKTRPLRTNVKASASESSHTHSTTIGSSGSHTHDVDISSSGSHTHTITVHRVILAGLTGAYQLYWKPGDEEFRFYTGAGTSSESKTSSSDSHTHSGQIAQSSSHSHPATTSSGGSAHSHGLTYGFYDDTDYPDHISVYIDGVDRTTALNGGTWDAAGAGVEDTVEITQYLDDQSTLRDTHSIEFRCTGGQGEIEAEVVMLMTVQAIAVT